MSGMFYQYLSHLDSSHAAFNAELCGRNDKFIAALVAEL